MAKKRTTKKPLTAWQSARPTKRHTGRELLRVYVADDGALKVDVLATWKDDPEDKIPQRLSDAVAKAVALVFDPNAADEWELLNRPPKGVH